MVIFIISITEWGLIAFKGQIQAKTKTAQEGAKSRRNGWCPWPRGLDVRQPDCGCSNGVPVIIAHCVYRSRFFAPRHEVRICTSMIYRQRFTPVYVYKRALCTASWQCTANFRLSATLMIRHSRYPPLKTDRLSTILRYPTTIFWSRQVSDMMADNREPILSQWHICASNVGGRIKNYAVEHGYNDTAFSANRPITYVSLQTPIFCYEIAIW